MPAPLDLTGQPFYRLTARTPAVAPSGRRGWLCDCVCGGTKIVETAKLTGHVVRSCGCLEEEARRHQEYVPPAARAYYCPGCGQQFAGHPNRVYCSARCKARLHRGYMRTRYCRACGQPFELSGRQTGKRNHCSSACKRILRTKYHYLHRHPEIQMADVQAALQRELEDRS